MPLMNVSAIFSQMLKRAPTVVSVCTLYKFWLTAKHIVYICLSHLSNSSLSPPREEELRSSVDVISET